MKVNKLPKSQTVELRLNFMDEIDYHNKKCGNALITPKFSKFMSYELLVDYFTRLKNSELNEHNEILLCYPYDKETPRDVLKKFFADRDEIFGSGRIVEINKREVIFSFEIIPTLQPEEIRRLRVHMEELLYGIGDRKFCPRIEHARIVVERR